MQTSSPTTEEPSTDEAGVSQEVTLQRSIGLEKLMTDRQLNATDLSKLVETDSFKQSVAAMNIAEARAGEKHLPNELAIKIVTALQVDPKILLVDEAGLVPTTSPPVPPLEDQAPKKRGRKPGSKNNKDAPGTKTPHTEVPSPPLLQEISLVLSGEDLEKIIKMKAIKLVQTQEGNFLLRIEKILSKDETIQLLLRQLKR